MIALSAMANQRSAGRGALLLRVVLLWSTVAPAAAFGIDITTCGQDIPEGEVAELRGELACGSIGPGVLLGHGATLNLNGFAIAGSGAGGNGGVSCGGRRCTVNGPGEIRGFAVGVSGINVQATNLAVRANAEAGVSTLGGSLKVSNVIAEGNGIGIFLPGGRRLRVRDVEANDNAIAGIWASGARVKLSRLTATRNGTHGGVFLAKSTKPRARIVDSTIVANAGLNAGYDVLAERPGVKLVDSTCDRGAIVRESSTPPGTFTVIRPLGCRSD